MDERASDDSLNLDSSGTIELGRVAAAQGTRVPMPCVDVPEPPRNVRCDTPQRELLRHSFTPE